MTDRVSDASSRLLTWIAAETPRGFPTSFSPADRAALAADVLLLIDALDINKVHRDCRLEYAPYTNEIYVYLTWALTSDTCTLVAVTSDEEHSNRLKGAIESSQAIFRCERVRLDEPFGIAKLKQQDSRSTHG